MGSRKKSGSGASRVLAFLFLLILVVGVGAGVAFRERIFKYLEGRKRLPELGQRPAPPPLGRAAEPPPEIMEPAPPAVSQPAVVLRPSVSEQAARERLDAATRAYRAFEFSKAAAIAMQAAESAPATPTGKEAHELACRAGTFHQLLKEVTPNPEAEGKLSVLRREGGNIEAVIEREDAKFYYVLLDNGIRAPIAKDEVLEVVPVPQESKRKKYQQELAELKAREVNRGALGLYNAGVFAYRNFLSDEALSLLEAAYRESPDLLREVSDQKAQTLLSRAIWNDGIGYSYVARKYIKELLEKYPNSRHSTSAKELLADIEGRKDEKVLTFAVKKQEPAVTAKSTHTPKLPSTTPAPVITPTSAATTSREPLGEESDSKMDVRFEKISVSDQRVQKMINEADQHFEQGMKHYLAGRPGSGNQNANQELEKAATFFEKAANLYTDAQELAPGTRRLEARASEAARLHYNCIKMQTITDL